MIVSHFQIIQNIDCRFSDTADIADFFVDNHWEKLPASWQVTFQNIDPQVLGDIILGKHSNYILPLSFLALIKTVQTYSLPRQSINKFESIKKPENLYDSCSGHPRLKNLYLKHVKLKKRHEVSLMAEIVHQATLQTKCNAVVDFGSGLGHLVRLLAYKYDLYAAGIECQSQLTQDARKHDLQLEYTAKKYLSAESGLKLRRPIHFDMTLNNINQLDNLELPDTIKDYGLIGLHPCGDLGPLLLKHFVNSSRVKFICVVGCCYMKLTCDCIDRGYPMSRYLTGLDSGLSYASREIACHAIEVYCDRLRKGNYEDLKIHAYRAALERILVEHDPKLRHAPVRSIKHFNTMTFQRYCTLAVEKLEIPLPVCADTWSRGEADLQHWRRVVTVYTLRLLLAPLVETVILLDRVLFVIENGLTCNIYPVFDPKISPRNHIIVARRA
ncbi:methyltransferase-like protein 25B isoform X2 [Galleria mellonella]|uniref:Methyltransferase-like protein 25B isoform X2 n=1 Tax=Galleria mellonella TaxID=7137 RepID=A0ABM3MFH3_GALME|nr:methyltransferase-like protein 25B isoform X2 [Galleria mellonella]